MGLDSVNARDTQWSEMLSKMQKVLSRWTLIWTFSLVLSKLNYVLASMDLPVWAINQVNAMTTHFIWDAKVSKIARKTLIGKNE